MSHSESRIAQAAVKAVIVAPDSNKILFVKQQIGSRAFWDLPGGRVETGEHPLEALKREVLEETGLRVTVGKILGLWWFCRQKDGLQIVCTNFLCHTDSAGLSPIDSTLDPHLTERVWMRVEELLQDTSAEVPDSMRTFFEQLKL